MESQTTNELIAGILGKTAKTTNRDRENYISQRENNSITKKLNNLKLNNPSRSEEQEDVDESTTTSSSLGPLRENQGGFVSLISGVEVQMKAATKNRQHAYITLQTHSQLVAKEAMNYTAYLVNRERGREFTCLNTFDQEVYDLTVENKHWWIAHLCERGTKQILDDVVVTLDPTQQILTLWFNDYSGRIPIPINNKTLTGHQQRYFISAGYWGQPIQLATRQSRGFLDCQSRVGGQQ